ncbi:uncharacterized protein PG986_004755 [Apiospora aurea]|uniref:Uncharacterized protein n=1 Tax=Apiospora aurea TaxID=335848 RepID=A0ABR1QNH6_9PEZI
MSTRGSDTGTGRPEDYTSRVERNTSAIDDGGPKMPDLRNVRSEPPQTWQPKQRRNSMLDTFKDALQPGDIRARKASQGSVEAGPAMGSSPTMSMSDPDKHFRQTEQKQQQHQMESLFEAGLHGPDYHHAPSDRHRSHGVMDHVLGRSRAHDDTSGIIGSRRDRAKLRSAKSTGPGEKGDPGGYAFDVPRGSREDPRRSAVDAVPRTSALDAEGAMSHEYSTRSSIGGTRDKADSQVWKNDKSPSQYLTGSGLYE